MTTSINYIPCRYSLIISISISKYPGVRPISVGEVLRRIVCKAILSICHHDIETCVGTQQLCVGHKSGSEAAIHALKKIFSNGDTDAVILVDTSNAFNSLNRKNAMENIQRLCPSLATITGNIYRHAPELFIDDQILLSQEGTTQGDPLAMAIYAISIMPLVHSLNSIDTKQIWFADDSSAGGTLDNLHEWWSRLQREGPSYGYHSNSSKTCIIVKENKLAEAHEKFSTTGISICAEGHEYLGSAIGTPSFIEKFIQSKVQSWSEDVIHLAGIASSQPHAAYSAYTHGLASKWNYILRTTTCDNALLIPLEKAIRHSLLPAITGKDAISDLERDLIALPPRLGGLGIEDPLSPLINHYEASQTATAALVDEILSQRSTFPEDLEITCRQLRSSITHKKQRAQQERVDKLRTELAYCPTICFSQLQSTQRSLSRRLTPEI